MISLELSDNAKDRLSRDARARLSRLADWDLSKASRRTQVRMEWSYSKRRIVEREYRKFLALIVIDPTKTYGMAGDVDELWHDHILDTQDYIGLCRHVIGAIIHHAPSEANARKEQGSSYEDMTLPSLRKTFDGRLSRVWPRHGRADAAARCCNHISEMPPGW